MKPCLHNDQDLEIPFLLIKVLKGESMRVGRTALGGLYTSGKQHIWMILALFLKVTIIVLVSGLSHSQSIRI